MEIYIRGIQIGMKRLDNKSKLFLIKFVHTAIWSVLVIAILYVLYAGIFDGVGMLTWFCIGLIIVEGIVLLICKGKCPLTLLAYNYTDNRSVGFDIFLPVWLAEKNKLIFSTVFLVGFMLVLWRVL